MGDILTIDELAVMLKMSRTQVYGLTRRRARARHPHPLPVLRINGNLRFSKPRVEAWLHQLAEADEKGVRR